jgi:hypothetical protein
MKYLKNHRAWRRWAAPIERGQGIGIDEPAKYPCFAYEVVASWGMEWTKAVYIYAEQVRAMALQIGVMPSLYEAQKRRAHGASTAEMLGVPQDEL